MKPIVVAIIWMRTVIIYIETVTLDLAQRGRLGAAPADGGDDSSIADQEKPPFWTWFIENPRSRAR